MRDSAPGPGEFLLCETQDGKTRVECRSVDDSLWLTQALMAELFQVSVQTISEHVRTLLADGEIQPERTIRKFLIVRQEGERQIKRQIDHLRVREIFAMAADYVPTLPETTRFFRIIQNKLHYAITGFTAAELIQQRAKARIQSLASEKRALMRNLMTGERRVRLLFNENLATHE